MEICVRMGHYEVCLNLVHFMPKDSEIWFVITDAMSHCHKHCSMQFQGIDERGRVESKARN